MNGTRKGLNQTVRRIIAKLSFTTNQYKQVVQKRIDLGALQKKIEQLHTDIGCRIGELYQRQVVAPMDDEEIKTMLEKLTALKKAANLLEEEIELIRTEPLNRPPSSAP